MKCQRCGFEMMPGQTQCPYCHTVYYPVQQNPMMFRKKSKLLPVMIIITTLLVGTALILGAIVLRNRMDKKDNAKSIARQNNQNGPDNNYVDPDDLGDSDDIGVQGERSKYTVMIYMIGSDLESESRAASDDIEEMLSADMGKDINVILQTGGCQNWYNRRMEDGKVQRFSLSNGELFELKNLGEVSMVSEKTLVDFIKYSAKQYPAEKYILVMWDHGGSVPISFGYDEMNPEDTLVDVEIGNALADSKIEFESIIFDACNMCTLEVAMSLKDYTEYMVAAESYVSGIGLYYTNWMNELADGRGADDINEKIVTDYMECLAAIQSVGSMSIIDMAKIDAVYKEYCEYANSVYQDIQGGKYAEYIKKRGACGLYTGTDSVDLITLANEYTTAESSSLVNSVVNAVSYTQSDFLYGHGLAVYSPYSYSEQYIYARPYLEELNYDSGILDFYDSFVSIQLAYLGSDYTEEYAGNWYDDSIVDQYVDEGTSAGTYSLEATEKDDYYAICLSDSDWDIVDTIMASCVIYENNIALVLGQDYYYELDEDGDIIIKDPDYWVYVHDNPACYIGYDSYVDENTGDWSQMGGVFATRNGEEILIVVYFDKDYPYGTALGYIPYDFETETSEEGKYYQFNDDDIIDLVYMCTDVDTGEVDYLTLDEPFSASELTINYSDVDLSESSTMVYYTIYDIYGNAYETECFYSEY